MVLYIYIYIYIYFFFFFFFFWGGGGGRGKFEIFLNSFVGIQIIRVPQEVVANFVFKHPTLNPLKIHLMLGT